MSETRHDEPAIVGLASERAHERASLFGAAPATQSDETVVPFTFTQQHLSYYEGETAAFQPEAVAHFTELGVGAEGLGEGGASRGARRVGGDRGGRHEPERGHVEPQHPPGRQLPAQPPRGGGGGVGQRPLGDAPRADPRGPGR